MNANDSGDSECESAHKKRKMTCNQELPSNLRKLTKAGRIVILTRVCSNCSFYSKKKTGKRLVLHRRKIDHVIERVMSDR